MSVREGHNDMGRCLWGAILLCLAGWCCACSVPPPPGAVRASQKGDRWVYEGTLNSTNTGNHPIQVLYKIEATHDTPHGKFVLNRDMDMCFTQSNRHTCNTFYMRDEPDGVYECGSVKAVGNVWVDNDNDGVMIEQSPVAIGQSLTYDLPFTDKSSRHGTRVVEKAERVRTPAGKFDCFRVHFTFTEKASGGNVVASTEGTSWEVPSIGLDVKTHMTIDSAANGKMVVDLALTSYNWK